MARIGRALVRELNNSRNMRDLNRTHPSEQAALEAFAAVIECADRYGVTVLPVIGGATVLPSGTNEFRHDLAVRGTEDEPLEGSILVRQVYHHEHGSCEVTAYFS